jgi:hypothetical protein
MANLQAQSQEFRDQKGSGRCTTLQRRDSAYLELSQYREKRVTGAVQPAKYMLSLKGYLRGMRGSP